MDNLSFIIKKGLWPFFWTFMSVWGSHDILTKSANSELAFFIKLLITTLYVSCAIFAWAIFLAHLIRIAGITITIIHKQELPKCPQISEQNSKN